MAVSTMGGWDQPQGKRDELWVFGEQACEYQAQEQINVIPLPQGGLKDLRCSNDQVIALMSSGQVFGFDRRSGFSTKALTFFTDKVVEIASATSIFAALDYKNKIYRWNESQTMTAEESAQVEVIEPKSQ